MCARIWEYNLKISKENLVLVAILLLGCTLRIYNSAWDLGHYLHPDERLYVTASNIEVPADSTNFFSTESTLNPKMFFYGPLPLYLYKSSEVLLGSTNFLFHSRMISALFSSLTIIMIYILGKVLFNKRVAVLAALVFAFAPSSIQYAHFNTTESILTYILAAILIYSLKIVNQREIKGVSIVYLGFLVGASYATKITGLTFGLIPAVSLVLWSIKNKSMGKFVRNIFLLGLSSAITGVILAPYQLIAFTTFYEQQRYMQGVILGSYKAPFVIIYEQSVPYIYSLLRVFPFAFGFLSTVLAGVGAVILVNGIVQKNFRKNGAMLVFFIFPLFYFIWIGQWYVKFVRYYILLFPFLAVIAGYILAKFSKYPRVIISLLIIINGLLFTRIYTTENTRIQASRWIYENISEDKVLLAEHWDDPLPIPLYPHQYQIQQLEVYNQPDSELKIQALASGLAGGDYFILSSRRVYYSILQNRSIYPYTSNMYDKLFSGDLGYGLAKKFTNYPFIFSDDVADESFQSYDHPPVYIFQNVEHLSANKLQSLIFADNVSDALKKPQ